MSTTVTIARPAQITPAGEQTREQLLAWRKRMLEDMQMMAQHLRDHTPSQDDFGAELRMAIETALGSLEEHEYLFPEKAECKHCENSRKI